MASVIFAGDDERKNIIYVTLYAKGEYAVFPLCIGSTIPLDQSIHLELHRNSSGEVEIIQNGSWVCDLFQLRSLRVDDFMIVVSPSRKRAEHFGQTWVRELALN